MLFTDEKHITVEINTFVPEANSPAEMGYSFYIATDQKLPSDTPIELKNTNLSVLFVSTKDYPTENTSESTLPPAVIGSKQELEEYISRYASRDAVFKEAAKEYDDDYFKENSLIFIQLEKGDPSTKPSVKRVLYIYDEKRLVIEIEHIENDETRDEAVYNIFMTKFGGPSYGFGVDTRIEVIESDSQT